MIYTWQQPVWDNIIANWGSMPNSWLLLGKDNTGLLDFSYHLSKVLLCEHPQDDYQPCLHCQSCLLLQANTHPDFLELTPEDEDAESTAPTKKLLQIKVEAVRVLIEKLHLSSHRGGRRVVLIHPAESMNQQSANALLKILEEPPSGVIFILVSTARNKLLPTIKSRCQQLVLPSPDYQQSIQYLQQQEIDDAEALLAFHSGSPLFQHTPEQDDMRDELIDILLQPRLLHIFDFAETFDKKKWPLSLFLDWLNKWYVDLLLIKQNVKPLYYPHCQQKMEKIINTVAVFAILSLVDELKQIIPYGQHTLNVKLQIEAILIHYIKSIH